MQLGDAIKYERQAETAGHWLSFSLEQAVYPFPVVTRS